VKVPDLGKFKIDETYSIPLEDTAPPTKPQIRFSPPLWRIKMVHVVLEQGYIRHRTTPFAAKQSLSSRMAKLRTTISQQMSGV
jgi:hypothetical protein